MSEDYEKLLRGEITPEEYVRRVKEAVRQSVRPTVLERIRRLMRDHAEILRSLGE